MNSDISYGITQSIGIQNNIIYNIITHFKKNNIYVHMHHKIYSDII